jgi:uncharacterized protein YacL
MSNVSQEIAIGTALLQVILVIYSFWLGAILVAIRRGLDHSGDRSPSELLSSSTVLTGLIVPGLFLQALLGITIVSLELYTELFDLSLAIILFVSFSRSYWRFSSSDLGLRLSILFRGNSNSMLYHSNYFHSCPHLFAPILTYSCRGRAYTYEMLECE